MEKKDLSVESRQKDAGSLTGGLTLLSMNRIRNLKKAILLLLPAPKKSQFFWGPLLYFAAILFMGCVTVTSDYDTLKADVNMLKKDLYETKIALADLKKDLDELQSIARAGGTEQAKAFTESQVTLFNKINSLTAELTDIRARFEEQRHFVDKFLSESKQTDERLQARLEGFELTLRDIQKKIEGLEAQSRMIKPEPASTAAASATHQKIEHEKAETQVAAAPSQPYPYPQKSSDLLGAPSPSQETERKGTDEPKLLYDRARELFKQKKYPQARSLFEEFIKKYPHYRLAGNCRFWIAETYYAEKNYEDAILNYEKVIKDYPSNEKVPTAYLKQAYSFIELGDKKTAKVILERLIEKFPGSEESKAAKRKLNELKGKR